MGLAGVWIANPFVDNVWRAVFLYVMYRRYLIKRKFLMINIEEIPLIQRVSSSYFLQ